MCLRKIPQNIKLLGLQAISQHLPLSSRWTLGAGGMLSLPGHMGEGQGPTPDHMTDSLGSGVIEGGVGEN